MKRRSVLPALLTAALVCSSALYAAGGSAVKGNAKSKVYHAASCKHYKAKGSTVDFASSAEAQKAGYKGCKQCTKPAQKK